MSQVAIGQRRRGGVQKGMRWKRHAPIGDNSIATRRKEHKRRNKAGRVGITRRVTTQSTPHVYSLNDASGIFFCAVCPTRQHAISVHRYSNTLQVQRVHVPRAAGSGTRASHIIVYCSSSIMLYTSGWIPRKKRRTAWVSYSCRGRLLPPPLPPRFRFRPVEKLYPRRPVPSLPPPLPPPPALRGPCLLSERVGG